MKRLLGKLIPNIVFPLLVIYGYISGKVLYSLGFVIIFTIVCVGISIYEVIKYNKNPD